MKLFDSIVARKPRLNKFNLNHDRKFTGTAGELLPILVQEIVPGDKFRVSSEVFMRMAPMLAPVMHNMDVYVHYFFVPNRLVWNEWEDFITGGREGTSMPQFPFIEITQAYFDLGLICNKGTLWDYMSLPVFDSGTIIDPANAQRVSTLPFRAYQMIYNEYYRDQNVQAEVDFGGIGSGSAGLLTGPQRAALMQKQVRAWEKDYFTSALPWAQRGEEVTLPIEVNVDTVIDKNTGEPNVSGAGHLIYDNVGTLRGDPDAAGPINFDAELRGTSTSSSINELRTAWSLQAWLEKNARGGARYIEQILSHFGVMSSDARLQRPEYLGGGRQPVRISEVLSTYQQTQEGIDNPPQGNMAGHGISGGSTGFSRRFEEHGIVIGLLSARPKTAYQQGIPRWMQRFDKLDHYFPEFANLGEQEVKTKELYYSVDPLDMPDVEETFGYQSRFGEMKYGVSTVHGDFRDDLAFWHWGRIFSSKPGLNQAFMNVDNGVIQRSLAVNDGTNPLYFQVFNRVDALRPMPYYGTPSIIGGGF